MSGLKDLTRWNRSGLSRFRYIDGNAIEYLEVIRQRMVELYADPETGRCEWISPAVKIPVNEQPEEDESLVTRQERLSRRQNRIVEMFYQDRRDWAWEISRTFARSCHILTEYANAYANEFYLGTATQWDHVRRLVEMLDYHPAPPASAYTRLAITAKENKKGIVPAGFKIQYTPETGGAKVVFETLADIKVDAALNELRPKGWGRSDDPAVKTPDDGNDNDSTEPQFSEFSSIANELVSSLYGISSSIQQQLDTLVSVNERFRVKDFLQLEAEDSATSISPVILNEFKSRAIYLCEFEIENGWQAVYEWSLQSIVDEDPESNVAGSVAKLTGKTAAKIAELQQQLSLVAAFIDHDLFLDSILNDLLKQVLSQNNQLSENAGQVEENVASHSITSFISGEHASAYSEAANWPALFLQGIGNEWAFHLDAWKSDQSGLLNSDKSFRIIDLLEDNIDESNTGIKTTSLKEIVSKAQIISDFDPGTGWDDIYSWLLSDIIDNSSNELANSIEDKSVALVNNLKAQLELVSSAIDQSVFLKTKLEDLITNTGVIKQISKVSALPVIYLQGVSHEWAWRLNLSGITENNTYPEQYNFKIKDFLIFEVKDSELNIAEKRLSDFITIATEICNFELEEGWSSIMNWRLNRITSEDPEYLVDFTGNTIDDVKALQQRINLIASYIDHPQFKAARLKELVLPYSVSVGATSSVATDWKATIKPKIKPDQLVMIYRDDTEIAEAATVGSIDEKTLDIHLLRDQVTYSWTSWPKGELALNVHPRFKKKCWLNGRDVIRTKSPHGLSDDSYIGWRANGKWEYAEVTEVDTFNLRVDYDGKLPEAETKLYRLSPITDSVLSKEYEVVAIKGPQQDIVEPDLEVTEEEPVVPDPVGKLFTVPVAEKDPNCPEIPESDSTGGGLLPPASLPKIGSFLFPSPMLPMDLVKIAVDLMLSLGVMVIPSTGEIVFKGLPPDMGGDAMIDAGDLVKMINQIKIPNINCHTSELDVTTPYLEIEWNEELKDSEEKQIQAMQEILNTAEESGTSLFKKIQNDLENLGPPLIVETKPNVIAIVDETDYRYMFNGEADKLQTKDWLVGRFTDGLRALKIQSIKDFTDKDNNRIFSLGFSNLLGNEPELVKVYAEFASQIIAEGAAVNTTKLEGGPIELDEVPEKLKIGKEVLLTAEGKDPVAAVIDSIDGNAITTSPTADGFTKGELVINANIVEASHGVSKPGKILGSGDAAKTNQSFVLAVADISFTPDATKTSGVAAAIEVVVADRIWEQVSTLKDSAPDDHHYSIRMTEQGYIKILFGDGEHGRRLPTGKNNIRVNYRVGSGIAGNVAAGSLVKPVNPNPFVKVVAQPFHAVGGGDIEDISSLRDNAPPKLLALERAVSLSDFSHLAMGQSSIWQAKAFLKVHDGSRTDNVVVVIVPAGGIESAEVNTSIEEYLQLHALPDVKVNVISFIPVKVDFTLTLRIKMDEFVTADVEDAVRFAIDEHFALKNRKLGEHLYLSEVYKVVENVYGVENSICVINDDKNIKVLKVSNTQTVLFFNRDAETDPSTLIIVSEGYEP